MKSDEYKTITITSEGFFKDRSSKFYAFAFPVKTEEEINEKRAFLRKKYYDARHHVFAYSIGIKNPQTRASDDGEPSNSSGPPILGQIRSHELTNILIVVIRYFGGTKLGIPGLINAYKTAAEDVISNNKIITKTIESTIQINFEYPQMNDVMRVIKEENLKIVEQKLEMSCEITVSVRITNEEKVFNRFKNNHKLKVILLQ